MDKPKVSILMACYNGEGYIDRSFNSVLAQTWPKVELIFVDDGSTDNSCNLAMSYRHRFDECNYELKIIRQDNQGACAAAKHAVEIATGTYLQILDVDDMIMPESCRLQAEFLEHNPNCDIVRTNGYIVSDDDIESNAHRLEKSPSVEPRNIFVDLIRGSINNWAGAYMVRAEKVRDFYKTHEFPISRYGQNLQFLLPLAINIPAGFIDEPLFRYIRHAGSHSNQESYEKQMENLNGYWEIRRNMLKILSVTDADILNICERAYHRRAMEIAMQFGEKDACTESYASLRELGGLTLELKVEYALWCNNVSQYYYRLCLVIKNLLKHEN